jgi:hypothetical protein
MTTRWDDGLDEVIGGDHVTMLASVTPAEGVVLLPVTNFATGDRDEGTIVVNSSIGAWKKLDRIRRNPNVALAFHTRAHASHARPEYVLAQGRARISEPIHDYPQTVIEHWERFESWRNLNPLWKRWLRIYAIRVEIVVQVERLIAWPDLECRAEPRVEGDPLPPNEPPPQPPPARGMGPRLNQRRATRTASRLPHVLLGWVGADGRPLALPVEVNGATDDGVLLDAPDLVPAGGRRAGLTAHWFARGAVGQRQRVHTGWMESDGDGSVTYAPHTVAAYRFPASVGLFHLVAGAGTRWRLRKARSAGLPDPAGDPQAGALASERQR